MNTLRHIFLSVIQFFKQTCRLPRTIVKFGKQRERRAVLDEHEAERLDRIRNPWKYRGM